jgi:GT2 family glycosyltransferase
MDLSIIIVSFNTKELLKKCLSSIFEFTKRISFEVVVVDNASTDSSIKMVEGEFPQVKLIKNSKNLGFGRGNNQGIKEACGKYIFLFNSDAYLEENVLPKLVQVMDQNPKIGVLAPQILNPNHTIQQSCGFLPDLPQVFFWMTFLDDLPGGQFLKPYHVDHDSFYKKEHGVGWITGAAMMFRREALEKSGLFDEKIFLYGEEVELCKRIKDAGFKIILSPVAKIIHLGRGSIEKKNIDAIVGEYKGLLYYYQKHKEKWQKQILLLVLKLGAVLRFIIFGLVLGRKELREAYFQAFGAV